MTLKESLAAEALIPQLGHGNGDPGIQLTVLCVIILMVNRISLSVLVVFAVLYAEELAVVCTVLAATGDECMGEAREVGKWAARKLRVVSSAILSETWVASVTTLTPGE